MNNSFDFKYIFTYIGNILNIEVSSVQKLIHYCLNKTYIISNYWVHIIHNILDWLLRTHTSLGTAHRSALRPAWQQAYSVIYVYGSTPMCFCVLSTLHLLMTEKRLFNEVPNYQTEMYLYFTLFSWGVVHLTHRSED